MKTKQHVVKWFAAASLLFTAATLSSCDKDDDDTVAPQKTYAITGNASGNQVVPAVSGTGSGTLTGTYDPNNRLFTYITNWSGLTGSPATSGFYNGASGSTGTIVGSPWTFSGTTTGTGNTSGNFTLTNAQAAQLTSGNWYYSYGTAANPAGEIRGQLSATQ
jgi:hypothetical protein